MLEKPIRYSVLIGWCCHGCSGVVEEVMRWRKSVIGLDGWWPLNAGSYPRNSFHYLPRWQVMSNPIDSYMFNHLQQIPLQWVRFTNMFLFFVKICHGHQHACVYFGKSWEPRCSKKEKITLQVTAKLKAPWLTMTNRNMTTLTQEFFLNIWRRRVDLFLSQWRIFSSSIPVTMQA